MPNQIELFQQECKERIDLSLPLVSIGILSYNRPKDLEVAMLSIINQTYKNIEILVSDNGSDIEEARTVIKKLAEGDSRIRTFFHQKNQGPLFNFDFLLKQASGNYFTWLADDDTFSAEYISDCVGYLNTMPDIVVASNMAYIKNTDQKIDFKYLPNTRGLSPYDKYNLILNHINNDLNVYYYGLHRIDCVRQYRYYLKKVYGADALILIEMLSFGDIYINEDKIGMMYQIHPNQTSSSPNRHKKITCINGNFVERNFFFTAIYFYVIKLLLNAKNVGFSQRISLSVSFTKSFIAKKRHHLIKYDLRINNFIQFIKRSFNKNVTSCL